MFKTNDKVVRKSDQTKVLIVDRVWGDTITCIDIWDDKKPIQLDAGQLEHWQPSGEIGNPKKVAN
jgi:hypothetical protein